MIQFPGTVGVLFVLTGLGLLILLREPLGHLHKPGSRGFALAVVAISLWPLSLGVSYAFTSPGPTVALWNVRLLAAVLVSVGWFMLAFEFTQQRLPDRRLLAALGVYLLVGQVLAWTNGMHGLVLAEGTRLVGGILRPAYGPWFWAQTVVNYALILAATGLLVVEAVESAGLRRRQSLLLSLATVPPAVANLLSILGVVSTPHDLTPFGLVGSGVLLSWALYRMELLEIVPIARETAIEGMGDPVVTLDDEARVVDCNPAARRLFDVDENYLGLPAREFFPESALVDRFADRETADTEISARIDGQERHFSLSISPIAGPGGVDNGRVVVLREITQLKDRERELATRERQLDLLRQVLTRVLRHNIRNELTTIRGNADAIDCEDHREEARRIVDASDRLIAISEKARHVDRIVEEDVDVVTYDLRDVAEEAARVVRTRYPDATIDVEGGEACPTESARGIPVAVENLVENAIEHNDAADPTVTVRVHTDPPALSVTDNGPGIPDHELAVLTDGRETQLRHGSGIGLWIVKWIADNAGADLSFETSDGTCVTLTFPVPFGPDSGSDVSAPE